MYVHGAEVGREGRRGGQCNTATGQRAALLALRLCQRRVFKKVSLVAEQATRASAQLDHGESQFILVSAVLANESRG